MNSELLQRLSVITEEEKKILAGQPISKELYTNGESFRVKRQRMLKKGQLIALRPHTRFAAFPQHSHNFVEVIYMCSGKMTHHINGTIPLVLHQGELLFLNQHASHTIDKTGKEDVAVNFIVLPQFFDVAYSMIGTDNILGEFLLSLLQQKATDISYLHFKVADVLPVQNLIENMVWSLVHRQPNHRRINQTLMGLLFLQLLNYSQRLALPKAPSHTSALALAALREIEENYPEATLARLAAERNVSPAYASAVVKQATGCTFKELLQKKRLNKAAQLLQETALSAEDIIGAVGYSNTSYFYRIFKEKFGVSPSVFRRQSNFSS